MFLTPLKIQEVEKRNETWMNKGLICVIKRVKLSHIFIFWGIIIIFDSAEQINAVKSNYTPHSWKLIGIDFFAGHICNSDTIVPHLADFSTSFQSILCINNQKGRSHLDMILSTEAPLGLKLLPLYIIFLFFFNFMMIVHKVGRVKENSLVLTCITKLLLISERGIKMRKVGEWMVLQLFLFLRICLHA